LRNGSGSTAVLTMVEDDDTVFTAIRAGALGYPIKGADGLDIIAAIRAIASGTRSTYGRLLDAMGVPWHDRRLDESPRPAMKRCGMSRRVRSGHGERALRSARRRACVGTGVQVGESHRAVDARRSTTDSRLKALQVNR
jgi:hypothetical protein